VGSKVAGTKTKKKAKAKTSKLRTKKASRR
jgi:hypothetical protein